MQKEQILKELQLYVTQMAKRVTNKPVKVIIDHLPGKVGMRISLEDTSPKSYLIIIGKETIKSFSHDITELKHTLLHEIAHIPDMEKYDYDTDVYHGKGFKESARKLGLAKIYAKANLYYVHSKETGLPVVARVEGKYTGRQSKSKERYYEQQGYHTHLEKMKNGMYSLLISEKKKKDVS